MQHRSEPIPALSAGAVEHHWYTARIADKVAGALSSNAAPIARPLQRPCWPRAGGRRDSPAPSPVAGRVSASSQAGALVRQALGIVPFRARSAPAHRSGGEFGAVEPGAHHRAIGASACRDCRHRPLKLTLPTSPPVQAVQLNKVYPTPCTTVPTSSFALGAG